MKSFNYFAPTEIIFGWGRVSETGAVASKYGKKALLVTVPEFPAVAPLYQKVKDSLTAAGLEVAHFDGVIPNPTTVEVSAGAKLAKASGAELVIGLGGGSSMDTAKAIAVEATHPGSAWDYLHYTAGPTEKTLPIIAIGTTAGTGSQTTPCSVITNTAKKDKSAIWHKNIFPRVAIVDPEVTVSMPKSVTAQTGFDAFCHNFEAYLSVNANPLIEALALDAVKIIVEYLPKALADGNDKEARSQMAWADTLGGLTNASAGVTLPHGLGMQIGGHCPSVTHGQALAVQYPEFTRFTWKSAIKKFATVGRIFDATLAKDSDEVAAEKACGAIDAFLKKIDLWIDLKSLGVTMADIREIADCGQVLGDYKNNPRVATIPEMYELLTRCYERK
ncbi:MAG: iron-containing alcohol dehydrogenase [Fusobacteriaceae bacterium]|jgi:alcohol dehydrogenase class IV|nr:iron-containing alcohol dehydrogenase [Fusobacteriaceae bacterium]